MSVDGLIAVGAFLALAVAVAAADVSRTAGASVSLPRAEWACSKSHGESMVVYEPLPEGGSAPRLVSVPTCDAWVRR